MDTLNVFKPGQTVQCVNALGSDFLTHGGVYIVDVFAEAAIPGGHVNGVDRVRVKGHPTYYLASRFVPGPPLQHSAPAQGRLLAAAPSVDAEANPNKLFPVMRGLLDYFPDACLEVANTSLIANEQHHPGTPMHWDKEKSQDEADSCVRHMMKRGKRDSDGLRHSAKAAWRALANLQREIEAERG